MVFLQLCKKTWGLKFLIIIIEDVVALRSLRYPSLFRYLSQVRPFDTIWGSPKFSASAPPH
jgi:hypothetical protein